MWDGVSVREALVFNCLGTVSGDQVPHFLKKDSEKPGKAKITRRDGTAEYAKGPVRGIPPTSPFRAVMQINARGAIDE